MLVVLKYIKFFYWTDCCDGSDEYEGFAKCTNNCWEAGKASREKLVKKVNVYKDGIKIRRSEIESGKKLRQQNDIKLTILRKEESLLSEQVKNLKGWLSRMLRANTTGFMSVIDRDHVMLQTVVLLSTT